MVFMDELVDSSPPPSLRNRAIFGSELHDWRSTKMERTEQILMPTSSSSSSCSSPSPLRANSPPMFPDGHHMLSFPSPNGGKLPISPTHAKNTGVRGPFTPSQWLELEQQAVIYGYIHAKAAIPSSLLLSIGRSMSKPCGNTAYPAGSLAPSCSCEPPLTSMMEWDLKSFRLQALNDGWGSARPGFFVCGSSDPETGRCRRTDGKKWRCSRNAVEDQKYCERHMNRGRHRSRKPVEAPAKLVTPLASPHSIQHAGSGSRSIAAGIAIARPRPPVDGNRLKTTNEKPIVVSHDYVNSTSKQSTPSTFLNKHNPFGGFPLSVDFGLPPSNSLPSLSGNYAGTDRASQPQAIRSFFDDWPRNQPDHVPDTWPATRGFQSSKTAQVKLTLDAMHVPGNIDSWEGGPLGEVLNSTNNKLRQCTSDPSDPNLAMDGQDSSPAGVLQKADVGSVSSSVARAENCGTQESNGNSCDGLLGSTFANSNSIPSF